MTGVSQRCRSARRRSRALPLPAGLLGGAGLWAELCCSRGLRRSTLGPERLLCGILCLESWGGADSSRSRSPVFPEPRVPGDGGAVLPAGCAWGKASRRPHTLSGRRQRGPAQPVPPYPIVSCRVLSCPVRPVPSRSRSGRSPEAGCRALGGTTTPMVPRGASGRPDGHVMAVAAVT